MRRTTVSVLRFSNPAAEVVFAAAGVAATVDIWRRSTGRMFDRYRPERHYMRGPGPKWREKHAAGATGEALEAKSPGSRD